MPPKVPLELKIFVAVYWIVFRNADEVLRRFREANPTVSSPNDKIVKALGEKLLKIGRVHDDYAGNAGRP